MGQCPIGAIAGVLGVLVDFALSERTDHERQYGEDKRDPYIQNSPPFWESRSVFRQSSDHGECSRYEEHHRGYEGKRTTPKRDWIGVGLPVGLFDHHRKPAVRKFGFQSLQWPSGTFP